MKVIITFTFCCDNLWKSKFMALEKPGNHGEFFSHTLWPPCINDNCSLLLIKNFYYLTSDCNFVCVNLQFAVHCLCTLSFRHKKWVDECLIMANRSTIFSCQKT